MNWKEVRLDTITHNLDGKRVPLNGTQRREKESKNMYPYIGANNIIGYIDEYIFDEKILCIAEDGGSWGKNQKCSFIVAEKCWVNNHAHVLTPCSDISLEYLMYYLNHADLNKYITGTTRGKLTKSALSSITIYLPSFSIQEKIVATLNKIDALRKKNQHLLAKYNELLQSVFYEMFGDPVTNEKEWKLKELQNLTSKITDGKHGDCINEINSGYYFISAKDLKDGVIDYRSVREITRKDFEETHRRTKLTVNDILIGNTGASIGKIAIVDNADLAEKTTFQKSVAIVTVMPSLVAPKFLFAYLFANSNTLEKISSGSGQKNLLLSQLRTFKIQVPPFALQNKFADIVQNIQKQRTQIKFEIDQSKFLFQNLLQKAFKGKLILE